MSHKYTEQPKETNREKVCIAHRNETMIYHAIKLDIFTKKLCAFPHKNLKSGLKFSVLPLYIAPL